MKKIFVKDLKEGIVFSAPVYIEGNNLLVPAGVAVRKKDITRLNTWGVDWVETDGVPVLIKAKEEKKSPPVAPEKKEAKAPGPAKDPAPKKPKDSSNILSLPEVY